MNFLTAEQAKFFESKVMSKTINEIDYMNEYQIMKDFPIQTYADNKIEAMVTVDTRKIFKNGFRSYGSGAHSIARKQKDAMMVSLIPFVLDTPFGQLDLLGQNKMLDERTKEQIEYYILQRNDYLKKGLDTTMAWACMQILLKGEFEVVTADGTSYKATYNIAGWQTDDITGNSRWSQYTQANSNPLKDIARLKKLAMKNGGGKLTEMKMNSTTFETFANHPKVIEKMGDRFKELAYQGLQDTIIVDGLRIIKVDDYYEEEDDDTNVYNYIEDGVVIFKVSGQLGQLALGTSNIIDNNVFRNVQGIYSRAYTSPATNSLVIEAGTTMIPKLDKRYGFIVCNTEAT